MTQLPPLRPDDLDDEQRALRDALVEGRGERIVTAQGGLAGPFGAYLHAPAIGRPMLELGSVLRWGTTIERRLVELAIITIGARWKAEYEWWAHARLALQEGVGQDVVDAIARGEAPPFADDAERAVHAVASQLGADGHLDVATSRAGHELLGDRGMVELVALCGYYSLISYLLNAFDVPLPDGVTPVWGG
jgi:4-carboxymuconolactone decarboxylase